MINIFSFLLGMGIALFFVIFSGWIDVNYLNKPKIELQNSKQFYIYLSAWEMSFLIMGVIIGIWII